MGRLVWIASYPKSGSTWVRAFLHNYIGAPERPYDINSLMDLSTGESGAQRYQAFDPRPASDYSIADVMRMRPLVHKAMAAAKSGLVFVKTHNASLLVEGVPLITPEVTAGAIYLVRDPRDVAVSFSYHLGLSIDRTIGFMADTEAATGGTDDKVYERLSSWSAHVHFWTRHASERLRVMRYEDMSADPQASFGGLVGFLGRPGPVARLERAIAFSAFDVLADQERAAGFVEQPSVSFGAFFRSGQAGRWREALTPAQAARIERDHGAVMGRFGYV